MPDVEQVVWVISVDYGTEGLSEPHVAFSNEQNAKDAMLLLLIGNNYVQYKLSKVPVWPFIPETADG